MPLNDYEFQLDTTGVLLNEDTSVQPFTDIERVSGLDSAPYRETVRDHEGVDGGFLDAEFERGRDIILEGTAYCDTSNVEDYLDDIKQNYAPVRNAIPFYFKTPGVDERILFVKPRGARYDWELARRVGITNVQLMMYAEDPRIYSSVLQSVSIPFGGQATTGFGFTNVLDDFTRSETDTWGLATTGETWVKLNAGDASANYDVNGTRGTIVHSSTNIFRGQTINVGIPVVHHVYADVLLNVAPTGAAIDMGVAVRITNDSNWYALICTVQLADTIDIRLVKNVAGALTQVATTSTGTSRSSTIPQRIEAEIRSEPDGATARNRIRAKTWKVGDPYPAAWQIDTTDTSLLTGNLVGPITRAQTGNTNVTPTIQYDNFQYVGGLEFDFGFGAPVPPTGGTVVVGGNRPTPAILTLTGPLVDPIIFNTTDSKQLGFTNITLSGSDSLVINLADRTVILNGTSNRRTNLTTAEWWLFNPGSTFVVLGGGSGSGTLLVEYRDAWR